MIKWLIQDVGIHMQFLEANFHALQRLNFNYGNFGLINSFTAMTNLENVLSSPDEHFIIRGGTKTLTLLDSVHSLSEVNEFLSLEQIALSDIYIQRIRDGLFYDEEKFDQAYYGQLNLPLLNQGATLYPIKDNLHLSFDNDVFIKPSKDLKSFTAGILPQGQSISQFVESGSYQKKYIDEMAVIAPCKAITSEYRFFVVEKEVITGSRYRLANQTNLSNIVPSNILDAAIEYAKLYQPHDIFTMDLAETPEGIFIVEYNCWNSSGLYHTDILKIFNTIQEYKEQQINLFHNKETNLAKLKP